MHALALAPSARFSTPWTPASLGASLLALWDAERSDLVTRSGGAVSSWQDVVGGYEAAQAAGGAQPGYSAGGFNGRPVIVGDGIDDELSLGAIPGPLQLTTAPCEYWAVVDQTAPAGDTSPRYIVRCGVNSSVNSRGLLRVVVGGVNRAQLLCGDGATITATNTAVDLSGRHVVRAVVDGTNIRVDVDGVAGVAVACAPASTASRMRLMANSSTTAGNFWQGGLNLTAVTSLLSDVQAAAFLAYLTARIG